MCGDDYAGDVPLGLLFFVLYLGFLLPLSSLVKWRQARAGPGRAQGFAALQRFHT